MIWNVDPCSHIVVVTYLLQGVYYNDTKWLLQSRFKDLFDPNMCMPVIPIYPQFILA